MQNLSFFSFRMKIFSRTLHAVDFFFFFFFLRLFAWCAICLFNSIEFPVFGLSSPTVVDICMCMSLFTRSPLVQFFFMFNCTSCHSSDVNVIKCSVLCFTQCGRWWWGFKYDNVDLELDFLGIEWNAASACVWPFASYLEWVFLTLERSAI